MWFLGPEYSGGELGLEQDAIFQECEWANEKPPERTWPGCNTWLLSPHWHVSELKYIELCKPYSLSCLGQCLWKPEDIKYGFNHSLEQLFSLDSIWTDCEIQLLLFLNRWPGGRPLGSKHFFTHFAVSRHNQLIHYYGLYVRSRWPLTSKTDWSKRIHAKSQEIPLRRVLWKHGASGCRVNVFCYLHFLFSVLMLMQRKKLKYHMDTSV